MPSLPLTPDEERRVLTALGIHQTEDLFATVPPRLRDQASFEIDPGTGWPQKPNGFTEHELRLYFQSLADKNACFPKYKHFLGGGIYDNIIPAIVGQLVLRGEFLTCYTPYQPEISQGTLQAIFEFQTLICRLTGMPIANASLYDGATATAEAALMAQRLSTKDRQQVLVAKSLHPEYRAVLKTFLSGHSSTPLEIGFGEDGRINKSELEAQIKNTNPCALIVGYPNYFGILESLEEIKALLPKDCLLVVSQADPSVLSIFEAPGNLGADVVVGEAHQFGTPMLFGGPHVGFFATRKEYLRQVPGRLCGETTDNRGNRCYTLTLSTREQHIRREKATSNICTNQGLIALRTTIYLSFLGKKGFLQLGETCYSLWEYLRERLDGVGIPLRFKTDMHYREGVFEVPRLNERFKNAIEKGIVPGIRLQEKLGEDFSNCLLVCVHPKHTQKDIDTLVEVLS